MQEQYLQKTLIFTTRTHTPHYDFTLKCYFDTQRS